LVQFTPDPRVAVSADYTLNRLEGVGGTPVPVTTHLVGLETRLAHSPRLQFVSFTQWNTVARQLSINARLAWEYQPLAYLTAIYNDRSPISGFGVPVPAGPSTRQLLVKVTWLLQL
jgi:hypothetical protein